MFLGQRVTNPYERLKATGQAPLPLTTLTRISACKPCKWEEMNKNARWPCDFLEEVIGSDEQLKHDIL